MLRNKLLRRNFKSYITGFYFRCSHFILPNLIILSTAAIIASSLFAIGVQPKTFFAFAFVTLRLVLNIEAIVFALRLKDDATYTAQLGKVFVETFFAISGILFFNNPAISGNDILPPASARKRCPFASGFVIARICRSATSRTSIIFMVRLGTVFIEPVNKFFTSSNPLEMSGPNDGPKIATGLITLNSKSPPSLLTKSHAARSASTLDLL